MIITLDLKNQLLSILWNELKKQEFPTYKLRLLY